MDRAAKAVRRSGVKLLSLGGGHGELNMVISEQKDVKNTAKAFMAAQNSAAQYLVKWAANEDNRAIQDVSHHITELNQIWTEAQREFVEQLKEFKHMFDLVLEGEKQVDYAKGNLLACEQREGKIKKELKKVAKKATTEELRVLESRLAQAERQKDLALLEVEDKMRENEAVKLIRFKDGYQKLSTAYMELSRKCGIIFEAQRDITNQLPDALNSDLEDIKYTGSGASKQFVVQAKERVRQYKRQQKGQNAVTMPALDDVEPPPPYTPGDFYDICYDNPYPPITGDLPPMQNQGNVNSSRQSQATRHRQAAINTRQQDTRQQDLHPQPQRPPQQPQLPPQPELHAQPIPQQQQQQLHQKKQTVKQQHQKQQKKPETRTLPPQQHQQNNHEAEVPGDVPHGPLLRRLVSVELPADGQPVGDQGQLVGDQGQLVGDRGHVVGDQGQLVGDQGQLVGDQGQAVGDQEQPAADLGQAMADRGQAVGDRGQAMGDQGQAVGDQGQAMGDQGQTVGDRGQAVGDQGQAMADQGQAVGDRSRAVGDRSQAVGDRGQPVGDSGQQPVGGPGPGCVINDLNWCSEDEDAYLSGAMGGMRL